MKRSLLKQNLCTNGTNVIHRNDFTCEWIGGRVRARSFMLLINAKMPESNNVCPNYFSSCTTIIGHVCTMYIVHTAQIYTYYQYQYITFIWCVQSFTWFLGVVRFFVLLFICFSLFSSFLFLHRRTQYGILYLFAWSLVALLVLGISLRCIHLSSHFILNFIFI